MLLKYLNFYMKSLFAKFLTWVKFISICSHILYLDHLSWYMSMWNFLHFTMFRCNVAFNTSIWTINMKFCHSSVLILCTLLCTLFNLFHEQLNIRKSNLQLRYFKKVSCVIFCWFLWNREICLWTRKLENIGVYISQS